MLSAFQTKFPFWQYLTQPIFQTAYPFVLNPRQFQRHYQVELLERCLSRSAESKKQCD